MAFGFQPTARPNAVEIAVDVQLQQVASRISRPARRLRQDPREARLDQIEPIDEGVNEPDRVIRADVVVDYCGQ
jgi:hypothetical protein